MDSVQNVAIAQGQNITIMLQELKNSIRENSIGLAFGRVFHSDLGKTGPNTRYNLRGSLIRITYPYACK